jgi:hypothetical protein
VVELTVALLSRGQISMAEESDASSFSEIYEALI